MLSVKGISRRLGGPTGARSVRKDLLSSATGPISLRARLVSMCALSVKKSIPDCATLIEQGYDQFWTHIIVRIKLVPHDVDNLPTPLEQWKDYWKMGIEGNLESPNSFVFSSWRVS